MTPRKKIAWFVLWDSGYHDSQFDYIMVHATTPEAAAEKVHKKMSDASETHRYWVTPVDHTTVVEVKAIATSETHLVDIADEMSVRRRAIK